LRDAQVAGEENNLAAALTQFKNQFGDYPPSRVILSETGVYPTASTAALSTVTWLGGPEVYGASDITVGVLAQRSLTALQKLFPKALLTRPANVTFYAPWDQNNDGAEDYWPDFNGNGVKDANLIYLE